MTSLTQISEIVIGVDTHVDTHTAAIVETATGGVLAEITVPTTTSGYRELLDLADEHSPSRVWAIEGTGGHGFGLAKLLERENEVVVELDRPQRAPRRHGAKSDPLDAVRAAREAMARPLHGTPRTGPQRQALSVLLAARRAAVDGATTAQRQLFSLAIAAPEPLRDKLRDLSLPEMVEIASRFRIRDTWDVEHATTARVLRDIARRSQALHREAAEHEKEIRSIVRAWRADLLEQLGIGPIVAATILCAWSHPGRVRDEAAFAMLAGVAPIPANSGRTTTKYRLNGTVIGSSIARCTRSLCPGNAMTSARRTTPPAEPPKARHPARSNAASSDTSHETSTDSSRTHPPRLDTP